MPSHSKNIRRKVFLNSRIKEGSYTCNPRFKKGGKIEMREPNFKKMDTFKKNIKIKASKDQIMQAKRYMQKRLGNEIPSQ